MTVVTANGATTTLNGTGVSGNGALENVSGTNTYSSPIILGSNATIGADTGSTLNLTGTNYRQREYPDHRGRG